jgi:hypothetical protein
MRRRVLVDVAIRDAAGDLLARYPRALIHDLDDGTTAITPLPDDLDDADLAELERQLEAELELEPAA